MLWSDEIGKVEVEYTGGNIWVAYVYVDEHTYYCADTGDYFLCKFDDRGEEEDMLMCMNVVDDTLCYDEENYNLTEEEQKILDRLLKALEEKEKEYYL